jgi:hypothetical protein
MEEQRSEPRRAFELQIPGTWVNLPDRPASSEVGRLVSTIESAFLDLTLALVLFESAQAEDQAHGQPELSRAAWLADREKHKEILEALEQQEREPAVRYESVADMVRANERSAARYHEADRLLMLQHWDEGTLPRPLTHKLPFLYAKSFLFTADSIGRLLAKLAERPDLPCEVACACNSFYDWFPDLREVRNSTVHIEDRARGVKESRKGKPDKMLDLKPVAKGSILSTGPVLVLGNLSGNRFGCTMANGHYGEMEISADSLGIVRDLLEEAFANIPWTGNARHTPS